MICRVMQFFALLYVNHILKAATATEELHHEERSQRGISLLNHTYKSVYSANYPNCLMACMGEPQCMSLNHRWHRSQCELDSKTKYSAETTLLSWDISSMYMGLIREAGNISIYNPPISF